MTIKYNPYRRPTKTISLEELKEYFSLPIAKAAEALSLSESSLKKICREHGVSRWPWRKIHSVENKIGKIKKQITKQDKEERKILKDQLETLEAKRDYMIDHPQDLYGPHHTQLKTILSTTTTNTKKKKKRERTRKRRRRREEKRNEDYMKDEDEEEEETTDEEEEEEEEKRNDEKTPMKKINERKRNIAAERTPKQMLLKEARKTYGDDQNSETRQKHNPIRTAALKKSQKNKHQQRINKEALIGGQLPLQHINQNTYVPQPRHEMPSHIHFKKKNEMILQKSPPPYRRMMMTSVSPPLITSSQQYSRRISTSPPPTSSMETSQQQSSISKPFLPMPMTSVSPPPSQQQQQQQQHYYTQQHEREEYHHSRHHHPIYDLQMMPSSKKQQKHYTGGNMKEDVPASPVTSTTSTIFPVSSTSSTTIPRLTIPSKVGSHKHTSPLLSPNTVQKMTVSELLAPYSEELTGVYALLQMQGS